MTGIEISKPKLDNRSAEAFKTLRTNLKFCGVEKKVIVVTSCREDEGKSSITLNLAISLAEAGERVLLLDADLRRSVLIGRMKVTEGVQGLTQLLSRQASLSDTICATNINNLSVIFTGPVPPNPAELLGGRLFRNMLNSLRKVYDYILIDTPPLGSVIDAAIIAEASDGAILVLESGGDSYRMAQAVKEQLDKAKCPVLGAVLNKVDMSKKSYYGKYYGKYYGGYYEHDGKK